MNQRLPCQANRTDGKKAGWPGRQPGQPLTCWGSTANEPAQSSPAPRPPRKTHSGSLGHEQQLSADAITAAGFPVKPIQRDSRHCHNSTDFKLCSRPSSLLHILLGNKHLLIKPRHKHMPQSGNHKKSTPEYCQTSLLSRDKIACNMLIATENSVFYIKC